jgi:hypothetical protein
MIPANWPPTVALELKFTVRPVSDVEFLPLPRDPEDELTPTELAQKRLDEDVEFFAFHALRHHRMIEEEKGLFHVDDAEQECSEVEFDEHYLAWLATVRELRVKLRPKPGLPASAFTTVDQTGERSPLAPYELTFEILEREGAA